VEALPLPSALVCVFVLPDGHRQTTGRAQAGAQPTHRQGHRQCTGRGTGRGTGSAQAGAQAGAQVGSQAGAQAGYELTWHESAGQSLLLSKYPPSALICACDFLGSDGAAAVVLASASAVAAHGLKVLAVIRGFGEAEQGEPGGVPHRQRHAPGQGCGCCQHPQHKGSREGASLGAEGHCVLLLALVSCRPILLCPRCAPGRWLPSSPPPLPWPSPRP